MYEFLTVKRGIERLDSITSHNMKAYIRTKHNANLQPQSIVSMAKQVKAFFNWCVREEYLTESPMDNVALPKVPHKLRTGFTSDEVIAMIDAFTYKDYISARNKALVAIIEDAVIDFLSTNNVFDNENITKSANEIAFYVRKAFFGHIKDYFKNNLHFNESTITESLYDADDEDNTDNAFSDNSYSLYESKSFSDFITVDYEESFGNYLDAIGGTDKVLTDRQSEVLTMSNIMSQRAVASELGVSEVSYI